MSFGGQNTSSMYQLKKFETQTEVDERNKIRQEEWEKVRKPEDPKERPEDDSRSLFEKLQEQKDRKQQDYEDQFKYGNAVKGLEKDEAQFLDEVSRRQMAIEKERLGEETSIINEMRNAKVTRVQDNETTKETEKTLSKSAQSQSNKKSQQSLLLGAVKRKSSESTDDAKKQKTEESETPSISVSPPPVERPRRYDVATVIGILPGIGNYSDDSTDSNSSNSDDELDDLINRPKIRRIIIRSSEDC